MSTFACIRCCLNPSVVARSLSFLLFSLPLIIFLSLSFSPIFRTIFLSRMYLSLISRLYVSLPFRLPPPTPPPPYSTPPPVPVITYLFTPFTTPISFPSHPIYATISLAVNIIVFADLLLPFASVHFQTSFSSSWRATTT